MTDWRPAHSITTLLDEVNAIAPHRSIKSDGIVGDLAHSARASDHNPNSAGVVRAVDITNDPAGGCDVNELMTDLAGMLGEHPALGSGAYLIWRSRIISTDRLDDGWRTYTGSNPHNKHGHLSVATNAAGYDSTAPWGVMKEHEDTMNPAQEKKVDDLADDLRDLAGDVKVIKTSLKQFRNVERANDLRVFRTLSAQGKSDDEILDALARLEREVK